MSRPTRLVALLTLTALAASGCAASAEPTSSPSSSTSSASTSSAPVPSTAATEAAEATTASSGASLTGQEWADHKVAQWWAAEGGDDFSDFYHPFNLVESWSSPGEGEIMFTVDPAITYTDDVYLEKMGPANDLWMIGAVMWDQLRRAGQDDDLSSITVQTTDGQRTEVYNEEDAYGPKSSGEHDPSTQAWADEMINLWLRAEGVRTVQGLLDPFNLIESWEATGPGELTVYAAPAILNDPTESELGPGILHGVTALIWQRLYCGAPELQSITVATTDGLASSTAPRTDWSADRQVYEGACTD